MPSWNWNESQSEDGVVHQSVANTDNNSNSVLKQGYDYVDFNEIGPTPVACWPLHENSGGTAYDVAGTYNGSITNSPSQGQGGLLNTTSYDFSGGYVDTNTSASGYGIAGSNPKSVSAWVYTTSFDGGGIFDVGGSHNDGTDFCLRTLSTQDEWRGQFWGNADIDFTYASHNQWVHFVVTFDGSTHRIYADGTEVGSSSYGLNTDDQNFEIGRYVSGPTTFSGRIWNVQLYDTALTQSEVQTLEDVVRSSGTWTGVSKTL